MTSIIICLEQFVEEKRKYVKRPSCRKEWYSYSLLVKTYHRVSK